MKSTMFKIIYKLQVPCVYIRLEVSVSNPSFLTVFTYNMYIILLLNGMILFIFYIILRVEDVGLETFFLPVNLQ